MKNAPFNTKNLMNQVQNTYSWYLDYNAFDTLRELYQNFYERVQSLFLQNTEGSPVFVVGSPSIIDIFSTFEGINQNTPKFEELEDGIVYLMEVHRNHVNGFHLYSDESIQQNEFLVVNGNDVNLIKVSLKFWSDSPQRT